MSRTCQFLKKKIVNKNILKEARRKSTSSIEGFPSGIVLNNLPANVQETQKMRVPSLGGGKSLRVGSGNPIQHSCLENFMDRGAWRAIVHGVAKIQT